MLVIRCEAGSKRDTVRGECRWVELKVLINFVPKRLGEMMFGDLAGGVWLNLVVCANATESHF